MKILISGVAGMIGSHLLDFLISKDYEIIGVDNLSFGKIENIQHHFGDNRFKFYKIDILDLDSLKMISKDCKIIIHLAAVKKIYESMPSMDTLRVNVIGTENIFKIAETWRSKVIFASTSDVYGMNEEIPFKEDSNILLGPSSIKRWSYAISKLYCEQLAYAYYNDRDVEMVILRYFNVFSPRSSFQWSGGYIPIFIDAILNDKEVPIHGDGQQTRSMAHIGDIIRGTYLSMVKPEAIGEIINIGRDEEVSVLDAAKIIHEIANTGHELKTNYIPMKEIFGEYKDIMRRCPDLTKAKELLGYESKISMHDAIERMIKARKEK